MIALCRHILPVGRVCDQAAVNGSMYCRHHGVVKGMVAEFTPKPDRYGMHKPIPFVFPEDHAAIQTNVFLVMQALNGKHISVQEANAFNRLLRTCEINLETMDRKAKSTAQTVQRVILTPEGDEIAPPHEALEPGESPLHYKDCPCRRCAEQYRGAAPEQHHADCKCGLCVAVTPGESEKGKGETAGEGEKGKGESSEDGQPRAAHAGQLYPVKDAAQRDPNLHDYLYGDEIRKYEAQYAARARAAIAEGIAPPAYEPWTTSKYESQAQRDYKAWREEIEENREAARVSWNKAYPDQQIDKLEPYLTWGEEEDLRLAEMKRLKEEEEARVRDQAVTAS